MSYELKVEDIYGLANALGARTHEKGQELWFKECPYCHGGNGDKDTFSVNLSNGAFKCFRSSCGAQGHFVKMAKDFGYQLDFGENDQKREYRKLPQKPIEVTSSAVKYLESRGISRAVCDFFHITTRKDDNNILVFPFYDENNVLVSVKYRRTDFDKSKHKNKEWFEEKTKPVLFGMPFCVPDKPLVITEGQIDSLSLFEAGIENAVSVPNGAQGMTWIGNCSEWLEQFPEIIIFGDNENGHITLVDKIADRIQKPIRVVNAADYYGEKDANDILRKYGKQALVDAVNNASELIVDHIEELADARAVDLNTLEKIETTIPELDRLIGGMFYGQVILLTGKRGEGKSTLMSQIIADALQQGVKTLAYSGELPDYHFKRWLDMQLAGSANLIEHINKYGDKVYSIAENTVSKISEWYRGKMYIYDNNSIPDNAEETKTLIDTIELAIKRHDIRLVCIDNLMTALEVDIGQDLYRSQSKFIAKLKQIAVKYNVVVLLVAHPKKTVNDLEAEDISGSGDIANRVDVILSFKRLEKETELSPSATLKVFKNRLTGRLTGKRGIELYYSDSSKQIASITSKRKCYGWENGGFTVIENAGDLPF